MKVNILTFNQGEVLPSACQIRPPLNRLYWAGQPPEEWLKRPKLAVVGSRRATPYGRRAAYRLAGGLAGRGIVIISGLAFGIDSVSHQAALDSGGTTAAVLPGGLDKVYPATHAQLARRISRQGTLLSEYPLSTEPLKHHFIARNRVMAALADAVLVVEAAARSGSLHTAAFALELGKPVLAVPGNIDQLGSEGCNELIKQGAVPTTGYEDVLLALGVSPATADGAAPSALAADILGALSGQVLSAEELRQRLRVPVSELYGELTKLEIAGRLKNIDGRYATIG